MGSKEIVTRYMVGMAKLFLKNHFDVADWNFEAAEEENDDSGLFFFTLWGNL